MDRIESLNPNKWISYLYTSDKIINAYKLLLFVNNNKISNRYITFNGEDKLFIPDQALLLINNIDSPLKHLISGDPFNGEFYYNFINDKIDEIIIVFIILTAGDMNAFSFIDPIYLPAIYNIINMYFIDLEQYLISAVKRIIDVEIMTAASIKVLFDTFPFIVKRTMYIEESIGNCIYKYPKIVASVLSPANYEHIKKLILYKYKNGTWRDIYYVFLAITYAPAEEL